MTNSPLPSLTLVVGGAASGKSAHAEHLVTATGRSRVYVATAEAWDDEMRAKVAQHRDQRGPNWRTIEEPRDIAAALSSVRATEVVLIDCATLWLTNQLMAGADLETESRSLIAALTSCTAPVVVVSNEVGAGIVPETSLGRTFRNAQGRLNQRLAASADQVITVIAGLPLVLKAPA